MNRDYVLGTPEILCGIMQLCLPSILVHGVFLCHTCKIYGYLICHENHVKMSHGTLGVLNIGEVWKVQITGERALVVQSYNKGLCYISKGSIKISS